MWLQKVYFEYSTQQPSIEAHQEQVDRKLQEKPGDAWHHFIIAMEPFAQIKNRIYINTKM